MNIVIRTDASIHIGSGHVMRCLGLAKALRHNGHNVSFASRRQQGDFVDFVRSEGFKVYELITPPEWRTPRNSADYEAWLQVTWKEDAESLIQAVDSVDLLIVDHYSLAFDWEVCVKERLQCKVFAIDDLVRKHHADLILDQTFLRDAEEYRTLNPTTIILAGSHFALLKNNFITFRKKALNIEKPGVKTRVFLSMGGFDVPNATLQILQVLSKISGKKPLVTVLLSAKAPNYQSVKAFSQKHLSWVTHIDFTDNMAEVMSSHHVAIGAPGGTAWERACLGIPSVIITLADNQKTISANLVKVGAAIDVHVANIESDFLPAYQTIIKEWSTMRATNLSVCDGLGLLRVIQSINSLWANQPNLITLRPANNSDVRPIFDWQELPETREYALNPEIPEWESHKKWMCTKLQSTNDYFYIIESLLSNERIGALRLDLQSDSTYVISIFIDPKNFGQGFGKDALAYVDIMHPNFTIVANVLEANIASQRLFTAANYHRLTTEKFIRSPIYRENHETIHNHQQ